MVDNSDPALADAYRAVMNDNDPSNWAIIGYSADGKALRIVATGSGDYNEFVQAISVKGEVLFGYVRVTSGDSESKRAKFVFVSWIGEGVGALKKARVSVHKGFVKQIFANFAIEVAASDASELREGDILARVKKAGGADYSGNSN